MFTKGDFIDFLVDSTKEYYKNGIEKSLLKNNHMNKYKGDKIGDEIIKAIIVDYANFMAMKQGIDLAMYSSDLEEGNDYYD